MGTDTAPPPTRLDPDGLLACTREVYWWAAWGTPSATDPANRGGALLVLRSDATARGIPVSGFRYRLLDAWTLASTHEHSHLRLGFPGYAAAMLMHGLKGVAGVRELLDNLEADLVDLAAERRARS